MARLHSVSIQPKVRPKCDYNHAFIQLNNGMSSISIRKLICSSLGACSTLPQSHTKKSPWNDNKSAETDASDHNSTSPQTSDLQEELSSYESLCPDFHNGICLEGKYCLLNHQQATRSNKLAILKQYPEMMLWAPRRMNSFLA